MKTEPEGFKEFWENVWRPHARHTDGRGLARDTFAKLVKGGADPQDIIDGARYFIRTLKDPQYIPLSATWLNRRAFEDLCGMERRYQQSRSTPKPQEPESETNVVQIDPDRRREMVERTRKLMSSLKVGQ